MTLIVKIAAEPDVYNGENIKIFQGKVIVTKLNENKQSIYNFVRVLTSVYM